MNVICPRCGDTWDMETLHEEAELRYAEKYGEVFAEMWRQRRHTLSGRQQMAARYEPLYAQVVDEFRHQGCVALRLVRDTTAPCAPTGNMSATRAAAKFNLQEGL